MRWTTISILLAALAALAPAQDGAREPAAGEEQEKEEAVKIVKLAVIVHEKNPVKDVSLGELRAILRLERQFWPNKRRCVLYLRSTKSIEGRILLDQIYKMTPKKFQKYWVRKLFSGQIPAKPSYVPDAAAAGSRVRKAEGAISVVLATEVPKGVRVLKLAGKLPKDEDYALVARIAPKS